MTACQWQERFDPTYPTYTAGLGNYNYLARMKLPGVFESLDAVETTGKIKKPLITVAGTMDALLVIKHQARAYEAAVNASRKGNNDQRNAQYRLYEVQNGNHIEAYVVPDPQLVVIQPHAQKAFDLLVDHVESNSPLPPSQCIPNGGTISQSPGAHTCAIAQTCSCLKQTVGQRGGGVGRLLLFFEINPSVAGLADADSS